MSAAPVFDFAFALQISGGGQTFDLNCRCQSRAKRLAIVGASGSGKSLTLQLLAGLLRPQAGHVRINGACYGDTARKLWLPPQQRQAGLVFQDYALFPHLTVAQNIAFGLKRSWPTPGHKQAARLAAFWLDKMQLERVAAHYPHQISGGQRQRTALARACIARPRWLLLDEPFAALDTGLRAQMRQWLLALQQELDLPMLLITHDPQDSAALAEEVAEMVAGRLMHGVAE
ncbi:MULTISPECIES: ATP-binding cassette domain-containing protein [Eikenella]|uniref:Fe3+/spermidine/putrescine ABC transporter ATP-binding protein n=1 Tax=Eikenella longinqua TaxID=1795827 RepID=A0A1A9S133_9NEIS|nr:MULTISPECIES: ATP-binding cassette domain-containing protein [Eikenella]OAM30823.1 Fe3+/spermidine/putrescine ABC transporter ATP-binding protein [Eikenella longinqua]